MQRKNLKNIFFGYFLIGMGICSSAYATSEWSTLKPGYYFGAGYTFAHIKNADIKDFQLHRLTSSAIEYSYNDRYGSGHGAYIEFGDMLTKRWGYELNVHYARTNHSMAYSGPVIGSGINTSHTTLDKKTTATYGEVMAVLAVELHYNLALYTKLGLGYQHQENKFDTQGYYQVINTIVPFSLSNTEITKEIGLATALEFRYSMTKHTALSVAVNYLATKDSVLGGNVGMVFSW